MQGYMYKNHLLIAGVLVGNGVESVQTTEVEPVVSEMTS